MSFAATLQQRIELKYGQRGDGLGWRLLYSPARVLDGADVAFIGLNPGGDSPRPDHDGLAVPAGSAYAVERWHQEAEPGNSPLQRQVLALFARFGVEPCEVLSGNLVPFRSANWQMLANRDDALVFGEALWSDILARAQPKTIIGMGQVVYHAVQRILTFTDVEKIPLNWDQIIGIRAVFPGGVYIGLPHLSRFPIVNRPASHAGVERLLGQPQPGRRGPEADSEPRRGHNISGRDTMRSDQAMLEEDSIARLQSAEARAMLEYLVAQARRLKGYDCYFFMHGVMRTFKYTKGKDNPFSFIINRNDLLFYVRKAGRALPGASLIELSSTFTDVGINTRGEIQVRLRF